MIGMTPFELALAAAVILAVLELLTGTFVLLGFCLGCLADAGVEALSAGFSFSRDALLFAVVAGLAITALRYAFARPGDSVRAKGDVNRY